MAFRDCNLKVQLIKRLANYEELHEVKEKIYIWCKVIGFYQTQNEVLQDKIMYSKSKVQLFTRDSKGAKEKDLIVFNGGEWVIEKVQNQPLRTGMFSKKQEYITTLFIRK